LGGAIAASVSPALSLAVPSRIRASNCLTSIHSGGASGW
jgi:hypothetical protein